MGMTEITGAGRKRLAAFVADDAKRREAADTSDVSAQLLRTEARSVCGQIATNARSAAKFK